MISKTLGQLTQDETRLWEQTFCSIWKGAGYRSKAADEAIAALRQYRAESEPFDACYGERVGIKRAPLDPRDPPHEEGSGIIGTYDPLNKGWWLNGPTIPRFEPDPRFEGKPDASNYSDNCK